MCSRNFHVQNMYLNKSSQGLIICVSQEAEEGIPGKAAVIQKHASEPLFGFLQNFWDSWSLIFVPDNSGMSETSKSAE